MRSDAAGNILSQKQGILYMLDITTRNINIEIYEKLILAIKEYFAGKDVLYLFLHGGCYWLALILNKYISDSEIVFNRKRQHCACLINQKVYDIRGRIPGEGFYIATEKDMKYMQKHFVPCFDTDAISRHLSMIMEKERKICHVY